MDKERSGSGRVLLLRGGGASASSRLVELLHTKNQRYCTVLCEEIEAVLGTVTE